MIKPLAPQPVEQKWYKGTMPTYREALGRIVQTAGNDVTRGNQMMQSLTAMTQDPSTPFYKQYAQPTNPAVGNLQSLGFDTSNLTAEWIDANRDWIGANLITSDTTGAPTKPGKKATWEQNVAYQLYQWNMAEGLTQQAEKEREDAIAEAKYWASRTDLNLSDEGVIGKVRNNFAAKYPTLSKLETRQDQNQFQPIEINRGVDFSDDDLYAGAWEGRNPDYNGNIQGAMVQSYLGKGNVWKDNADIDAKLYWKNQDTYSPYSVGMTLEDEGVYFNAPKFTRETVEAIRQDLDLTDKNEVKMFNNVVSALNFTEQAQYEQKLFMDTLNKKLEGVKTEEEARRIVERLYNNGVVDKATKQTVNFGNLKKMDESLKGTSLINTTDAIDWKYDDVIKYAVNVAHDNENRKTTHDVQADLASPGTGIGASVQAAKADIEQRFAEAQNLLGDSATPAEEKALTYTGSSGYDSLRNVFEIYNPANLMSRVMGSITTGNVENALDTYQGYSAYQQAEARLPYVQAEIADLESRVNANDKEIGKLNYFRDMLQAAENGTLDSFGVINIKQYSKIANAVSALEAGETQYQAKDGTHEYLMDIYEAISGDDNRYPTADEHIAARKLAQEWFEYLTSDKVATGSMPEGGNERLRNLYKDERSLQDQLEANKESHAEYARASQANRTMLELSKAMGLDTGDLEASIAIGDYLNYFTEYHGTKWESYNAYDTMMQGLGAGATYEDVKEAASEGNAKVLEALEDLNFVREYTAEKGIQLPEIVEQGLEREEARLNRVLKDYEYFTKQEASNFAELAAQGKELEESQKPTTRPGNVAEYEMLAPTDYGLINASFYGIMTEEEKNTYYYLYASEGAKAAEEYYMYLANPTYGVLQTRYAESVKEGAKAEVDSGFAGGAWANAKAILSAPLDFAGSLAYMIYSGVTGEEFNPNNSALSYGKYAKAVNQATAESIQETFKDNPVAQTVLGGLYEMVYNRGRSMVNGLMTGGFTSMIGNGILQELAGAAPMAVSAMADAIAEAKDRGAEDWQAWLIGAATFFAEDFTEGITYGNIRDTITGSPDEVVVGFKNLMKNWLLNSGVEEMFGEGFNDWFENQADQMIMGELSEHAERVARIKADNEGITDAEAEAMARREELEGLAHTMVISYLGAGLDVPVSTMKSFLYEQSYARQKAKEERANGGTRSISEIRKEFHAQRMAGEVPTETQNAPQEQPAEAAPATAEAVQEETDAVKVAKGVAKISAVRGADTASNTAAVASALGGEAGTIEGDTATAAATGLAEIMNGNSAIAAKTVKNIMLGALDANVPVASVQAAIKSAGLSASSQARGVMASESFAMATGAQQAAMLAETISIDVRNPVVQQEAETAIHESRVAEAEKVLIANGALNGTKTAMQARDDAAAKLANAREELGKKTAETLAKSNAFERATQEMAQNPTADNQKNLDRALNELNGAITAEEQYNDSVDSMQSELDKAQSNLNDVRDQEASALRQQAEDAVVQIDQQRAEIAAQQAEQQRILAEQQAQAQAEEDERSGKAWEDKRDGLIEDLLNQEHLEGEERDTRREELLKRADQIKLGKIDMTGMVNNAEGFLAVSAFGRKLGIGFQLSDNLPDNARGMYENGVVYLNNNLIKKGKLTVGQALVEASLHEITHSMENTKNYKTYRQVVLDALFTNEDGVFDQAAYDAAIDQKIADYRGSVNQELSREKADAEIVADFARTHLNGRDVVKRFMDAGLGGKMRNTLHNINQAIKNFRLQGEEKVTAEYLRRAERAFQKAMDEVARTAVHPDGGQFSIAQIAQATEMRFDEETRTLYDKNDNEIDGVNNKITADMIWMTPVGLLIRNGLSDQSTGVDENGNAKPSQQAAAMEMMAGLMNMVARYRNSNLVWEIGSATLSSTFSALKSNSDPQYATTVDFGTVCAKTQAIIDVMSQVMLDRVKSGKYGGLTREEIMKVYNETHKAGLSVPCPVCYVFSRWMGVPSLLGQMSTYQHDYVVTKKDADGNTILNKNGDAVIDVEATQAKVNEYIKNAEAKYGDAKAINNRKTQLQNQQAKLQEQRLSVTNKEEDMALLTKMTELDKQIGEVSAYNWVTQALCKKDKNGNYVVDEKFRLTPDEILFDLNRTGEFAGYEKNWRYRNTRGAGMGKAIMPYSGETIGDILYGVKAQGRQIKNPWLNKDEKAAARQLKQARERAKKQNLVGGQRLQSTSDFRPEWGLDYLMSFLELQAAGSKVQMYTKVAEAVDFFASVGADVNLSIMAKNNGFHEASAEEIAGMTDEQREAATVDGEIYVMDFSNITGMDYGQATNLKNKYDSVQMILVGMNDTHIRLALKNSDIDFVIPWHSSGNSKDVLSGLISSVGERLNSSVDYTTTQTDMVKGTVKRYKNEKGETVEYTVPGKQTEDQKKLWDARVKLLTKGDNALTKEDRRVLLSNPYTAKLYERFTKKGVDPDCYGVKLNKSQATQIFPYEYWKTDSAKENADVNGKRFVEYCEAMGIVPRFSQFKDDPGYWKLLIDRPMYNRDGSYHQQKVIDVTNARIGELNDSGNLVNSDLPSQAQAKYAPKDPRNENYKKYTQAEKQAIENAEVTLGDKPYDDGTNGQLSVFGDTTDADLEQMLSDASQDYQDAVDRGDMEAAAEDVDFYAMKAFPNSMLIQDGKFFKMWHHTNAEFTSFLPGTSPSSGGLKGIYFTPQENSTMSALGERHNSYYLNVENLKFAFGVAEDKKYVEELKRRQKGVTDREELARINREFSEETGIDAFFDWQNGWYNVLVPEKIKSADVVTYDDQGNVIPLSERFSNSQDFRYSSGGENTLSDIDNQLITTGVVTEEDLAEYNNLLGIPVTDNGGAQRQFGHQTAQQGSALHDEVKEYLYTHSSYTPDTNDAQVDRAIGWVQQHASTSDPEGYFSAMQEAESADFDYRSADGQARMLTLMGMAALKGDTASELRLADAFNKQGTDLGRMLQARKLFRMMTPLGRVSVLQQEANRINEQYAKDGRNTRVALSEWTLKAAEAAETEEDFDNVRKAAAGELAEQMPANWKDKLTGWRMLAMLGNPRTHIRNVLGNALFMPAVGLKNKIGALAELGLAKENRTKTLGLATQDARAFAKDYASAIKDELTGEAKYNDGNLVQQQRKTWGTGNGILSRTGGRLLQGLSDLNGNALEAEDWIFLNRHFRNALAGYMTARGLTSKDMTGKVLEDAQTYAIQEAQKATYRDANKLASTLSKIGREGGLTGFIVNAVLPFKKTPANILKRGIEYSPVGIVKALTSDAKHLKEYMDYQNGKLKALPEKAISPSQWIDKVSSGLTGTGIMALGFLLSSIGAVKAGLDDDDEFDKLRGEQDYSMNPGKVGNEILQLFGAPRIFGDDVSMTIDWAAPMSMPLFVGATLYNAIERLSEGDEIDVGAIADSILNITEPVFNLSMLDGVNSLLDVNTYGEANALTAIGEKVLTNYATSFVPTLLGQAARTIDTTRRKAFVPSGASLQTPRYALEQTENKIPFLSRTNIPYRNAWGDTSTKEMLAAGLENFFSPAYINPIKDDAVTDELERLYNTVSDNNKGALTPKMPNKKLNDEALNAEQYDQLTVERGQTAHQVLSDLMQTAEYTDMADDETRAGMVADVWTYATQRANYIVSGGKTKKDKWVSEAENGDPVVAVLQRAIDRNKNDEATGFAKSLKESLASGDLETAQTAIAGMRRADKTDTGIKTTVTNVLKPLYQKAYLADDDETMFEIETMLDNLDDEIQWKYGDWLKNLDDVEEEEETGLDTKWLNTNN